jgi:hypothetical protein
MPTLLVQKAAKPCNGAVALKNREGRSVREAIERDMKLSVDALSIPMANGTVCHG